MNQRIIGDLSQAIYRAMPRSATGDQKATVDQAARAVVIKHFDLCDAEANELDQVIASKGKKIADLNDTIRQLRAEIIAADSAFNLSGRVSTWDETVGLVRMCHEGRAALDELARFHDVQYAAGAAAALGMIRP